MAAAEASTLASPRRIRILVALLLAIQAALLLYASRANFVTADEPGYFAAGVTHWRYGEFDLYRVNPPLARMISVLPALLVDDVAEDYRQWQPELASSRGERVVGQDFVVANGARYVELIRIARLATILWTLLGSVLIFGWTRELFGVRPALLALVVWCFDPNILAHGSLLTPDMPATVLGLAAMYAFSRLLAGASWRRTFIAGTLLGLALLAKSTNLYLLPVWAILAFVAWRRSRPTTTGRPGQQARDDAGTALLIINLGYGFQGTLTPLGAFAFTSDTLAGASPREAQPAPFPPTGNRFRDSWLGAVPLPRSRRLHPGPRRPAPRLRAPLPVLSQRRVARSRLVALLPVRARAQAADRHHRADPRRHRPHRAHADAAHAGGGLRRPPMLVLRVRPRLVADGLQLAPALRAADVPVPRDVRGSDRAASRSRDHRRDRHARRLERRLDAARVSRPALRTSTRQAAGRAPATITCSTATSTGAKTRSRSATGPLATRPTFRSNSRISAARIRSNSLGLRFALPPRDVPGLRFATVEQMRTIGPHPGLFAVSVNFTRGLSFDAPDGTGAWQPVDSRAFVYFRRFTPIATAGYSIRIYCIDLARANAVRTELGLIALPATTPDFDCARF